MMILQGSIDVASKLIIADIPLLIAHLIASIAMLSCLFYFVYKPFKRWIGSREKKLRNDFNSSQIALQAAKEKEVLAQKKLEKTQLITKQMLMEANSRSVDESKRILEKAKRVREQMLTDTELETTQIKKTFKKDIEKEILINAITLSEKLLVANLDTQKHQKLIKDFLANLDE